MATLRSRCTAALATVLLAALAGQAAAQADPEPAELTGTLAKARATGALTIGYREASIPFSFRSTQGEPIGYSIDLCRLLVEAIGEAVGRGVAVKWQMVTAESRIPAVVVGHVDLECGSTTINLERQKQVAFSPTIFVSGTRLMVPKGSRIRSFRELAGKRVVVSAGTTNEKTMRDLAARFKVDMEIVVAADHAASFATLTSGRADAFATDEVLLYGLMAQNRLQKLYEVVGDVLSYDPYGVMFRKGDAPLAALVDATFRRLAEDGEIERRYTRWFLRTLPSGVGLGLPMSPQLETLLRTLVTRTE